MRMTRPSDHLLPFKNCANLAPLTPQTPGWNRQAEGSERVLRDWEQEMVDLVNAYCASQDPDERKQLINQYNYLYTMHNYSLGTIIGRKGLALASRFNNVPGGTPPYMYQWVEDAIMSEVIWTPAENHKPQVRPNTIPVYSND
jgi:peptide/nickel transport system substrate-binding protein